MLTPEDRHRRGMTQVGFVKTMDLGRVHHKFKTALSVHHSQPTNNLHSKCWQCTPAGEIANT